MAFHKSASRPQKKTDQESYDSWSFKNKSFATGFYVSILWHVFIFFVIQIVVPAPITHKRYPNKTSALKPALSDSLFRSIVESRISLSESFYEQQISDIENIKAPAAETIEKEQAGQVVVLPSGRRFLGSLRELVGGDKIDPAVSQEIGAAAYILESDAGQLEVLSTPLEPILKSPFASSDIYCEYTFALSATAKLESLELSHSCGAKALDVLFEEYLKGWVFSLPSTQKGRVVGRVRFFPKLYERESL